MWSIVAATVFILQIAASIAKVYQIPVGWSFAHNTSLRDFPAYGIPGGVPGSYWLVSTFENGEQQLLLSDNGTFGLAFLNFNGTGRYYLSLMMGTAFYKNSTSAAPVWTANRNMPVSRNSILVNSGGGLNLLDSGSVAWSSPKQNISSLSLEESGNLKLLGSSGDVVWQSFDHPADVLLPTQKLITGQRLTSSKNLTSMSEGPYTSAIEPSGWALYYKSQTYFAWSVTGALLLNECLKECPGFQTTLSFTLSGGLSMRYEPTANSVPGRQPCSPPLQVGLPSTGIALLQLGQDGNLNSYVLPDSGTWKLQYQLTQQLGNSCQLALPCGPYGICSGSNQCECLGPDVNSNRTLASATCSKPGWASLDKCSIRYETKFVTLSATRYYANQYTSPDRVSSALEDCLESCRRNCSCAALFYDNNLKNCYFQQDILGSLKRDQLGRQFTAFLKYQNYSKLLPLPSEQSNEKLVIGLVSGAGSTAVALACCVLLLCYYRSKADTKLIRLLTTMDGPPHKFSYRRLLTVTKGFSKQLGAGGFGTVYEGAFYDGKKVAVKKLHSRNQGPRQFISEVASLGTINHINIVKLYGFCADRSHRLLVYDYMPKGSLDKWIFQKSDPESPMSWSLRQSVALGVARGLAYLHEESREPILHLDIKPQNILLDENFVAKLADFGMARLLMSREVSQVVTDIKGTPGYLAPEWLLQSAATKKCDVYSYGMVLLELIGGRRNLEPERLESDIKSWFFPAWAVNEVRKGSTLNVVDARVRDQASQVEAEKLVSVAFWCIQENPADRPTMTEVVQMLEGEQDIPEPPRTFHFAVQATGILAISATTEGTAVESFISH